ncbi:MAG: Gfo/Idh/MocA family oxidoreductase [SAR324 cluster bacterium]|nr:Gfo/Idh/MocA family oxidoreductase [SAR324 cluster bacterium]
MIGCGMMGQEHLRNLNLIDDANVVAVFEPDDNMAQIALALTNGAKRTASIEELIKQENIDALVISSPNFLHAEQLEQVFQETKLPVLVEKPVVTQLEQVEIIRRLAERHPAPVWVGMEYRYMPAIAFLIEKVNDGILGHPKMLTIREHRYPFLEKVADWNRFNRYTGGTLVEKCCHYFDLMRLLVNANPVRVMSSAGIDVNHQNERYKGEQPDILDNAYVIVEFDSGQRAMLELCMFAEGSRFQEEICVIGPEAKAEAFVPGPNRFHNPDLGTAPIPKVIISPRDKTQPQELEIPVDSKLLAAGDHNGSTFFQHQRFLNAIKGKGKVEVTVDDGLKAIVMGLAAQHSAQIGKTAVITNNGFSYTIS